ncbi:alpha/beta hydrolase [Escherichia coli]
MRLRCDLAAYPHLKGDDLAEQAQALSNRAYEEAAQRLPGTMRQMEFTVPGGAPITGFLHMPKGDGPFPDSINVWWSGCDADGLLACMNVILRHAALRC